MSLQTDIQLTSVLDTINHVDIVLKAFKACE